MKRMVHRLTGWGDPDSPEHVDKKHSFIAMQLIALAYVGFCFLLWGIVEHWWPDFFSPFKWSRGTDDLFTAVTNFWPIFAWGAFMATLSLSNLVPSIRTGTSDEGHFIYDTITSTLAGTWEELGFRCVFILGAMISIMFSNFIWAWLLVFFAVVLVIGALGLAAKNEGNPIILILGIVLAVAMMFVLYWTWNLEDPVYWLYKNVVFNILSFISLGYLDPILNYPGAPFLFIAGAISANAKFRDGHKYQGPIGVLNAWMAGFVLLYAMLYYSLLTAIIVHAIYDLEFAFIRYLGRKVDRLQKG